MRQGHLAMMAFVAAAASIALAVTMVNSPSVMISRKPLVPGVSEWMKAHPDPTRTLAR
jgi:hypothetical protein